MSLEEQIETLKQKIELKSNIIELQSKIIKFKDESLLDALHKIQELKQKK